MTPEEMERALPKDPLNETNWFSLADRRAELGLESEAELAKTAAIRAMGEALAAGNDPAAAFVALINALPEADWVREAYASWVEGHKTAAATSIAQAIRTWTPEMIADPRLAEGHWRRHLRPLGIDTLANMSRGFPHGVAFGHPYQADQDHRGLFLENGQSVLSSLPVNFVSVNFNSRPQTNRSAEIVDALTGWPEWGKVTRLRLSNLGLDAQDVPAILASPVISWDRLAHFGVYNFPMNREAFDRLSEKDFTQLRSLSLDGVGMDDQALRRLAAADFMPRLERMDGLSIMNNHDLSPALLAQMQHDPRSPNVLQRAVGRVLQPLQPGDWIR